MSCKHYVFASEAEAQKHAANFGGKATIAYRGDYRNDWLVTVED